MSTSNTPLCPSALNQRLTLSLPQSEVQNLIRLAELAGTTFSQELLRVLAFFLDTEGGLPDPKHPLTRAALAELNHLDEPWESVSIVMPMWARGVIRDVAWTFGITEHKALALLTRRTVRGLLRLETRALERGQSLTEALFGMIDEDTEQVA